MSHQGTRQSGRDRSRTLRRSNAAAMSSLVHTAAGLARRSNAAHRPRGWPHNARPCGRSRAVGARFAAHRDHRSARRDLLPGLIGTGRGSVGDARGAGLPGAAIACRRDGEPLLQSDGSATSTGDGLINVNVPAGVDFLEVQSLGGGGTYKITDDLIPTDPALEPLPIQSSSYAPIAVGDLNDNGAQDLVTPDGIHLGVGDGTFESKVVAGPLADSGWTVTAIAVGNFSQNALPDIAFTEISPDRSTANLCVLKNRGRRSIPASSIRSPSIPCPPPFRRSTWVRGSSTSLSPTIQQVMWRYSWAMEIATSRRGRSSTGAPTRWRWRPAHSMTAIPTSSSPIRVTPSRGRPGTHHVPVRWRGAVPTLGHDSPRRRAVGAGWRGTSATATSIWPSPTTPTAMFRSFWVTVRAPSHPLRRPTPWAAIPWPLWPARFETTASSTW